MPPWRWRSKGRASAGAETVLLDLRELDLPMYDPDNDDPTASAARLIESCYGADGMLWSSPMYQGTISGAFKNALDWLHLLGGREPPFLHDKVVGLVSASGGTQYPELRSLAPARELRPQRRHGGRPRLLC